MATLDVLTAICWAVFWLYWFISAISAKKNARSNFRNFRNFALVRIVIFALAVLLIRLLGIKHFNINTTYLTNHNEALAIAGFILFMAGLSLAVWARVHLGKNWGMPMSLKQDPELVTSGPYSYIRHPIYTGVLLAMLGTALTVSLAWLVILVVAGAYFVYSAKAEEKIMLRQFPATYPTYMAKTKMLIPFVL